MTSPSMPVLRMDDGCRRLLEMLNELQTPDKDPRPMVLVWTDHCAAVLQIPANEYCSVDFGEWQGPPCQCSEILVHAEYGNHQAQAHTNAYRVKTIRPGENLAVTIIVSLS